jgi:hypothetical protein
VRLYKPITTVAVGGLRRSCLANRLPVLSSKAWPSGSISSLWAVKRKSNIFQKKFPRKILILEPQQHPDLPGQTAWDPRQAKKNGVEGCFRSKSKSKSLFDIWSSMWISCPAATALSRLGQPRAA